MEPDVHHANRYLKQLSVMVKRPIQWAFFYGVGKAIAVILQLSIIAKLADNVFVAEQPVIEQGELIVGLVLASIVRVLLLSWQNKHADIAAQRVTGEARQQLFKDWQAQVEHGQYITAADGALQVEPIAALQGYFQRYVVQQYLVLAIPLLILLYCFYINPVVGLLLLLAGPVIPLFMALVGIGAEKVSQQHAARNIALSRVFTDKLRNLTTIKLFNAGNAAINQVAHAGEEYRRANMATLKIAFLSSAVLEFFSSVAIAAVALYVGFGLLGYINWWGADQLTLYSGLLVLLLAPEYFAPLRQFAQSYHDRAAAIGAASVLQQPKMARQAPQQQLTETQPEVALSWQTLVVRVGDKTLSYPDANIQSQALTVISGPSGVGKTVLLRTLMQQMPYSGELRFADAVTSGSMAYFSQQPFLMAASLRDNLNLFQRHNDDELLSALASVKLDTLLSSLPGGLDYQLAERGRGLSGGEQRRLALARCLLAKRSVLVADEPTENLDAESVAAIIDCLEWQAAKGATVIVASHDPQLLKKAQHRIEVGDEPS